MQLTRDQWNNAIRHESYLQAWSMVHFLAHADNGRYQKPFDTFLRAVGKGAYWKLAWRNCFGEDVDKPDNGFERRWAAWWLDLPANPTATLYDQATVATITSFFARAFSQKQKMDSMEDFSRLAEQKDLKCHCDDWLPPALLLGALVRAERIGEWSLVRQPGGKPPYVRCARPDGVVLLGGFALTARGDRVDRVAVQVQPPASQPAGK
jgi:hypothetical protein